MMPKMNGVEVLQKLRAEGIKTPIMMLTAKAEKDDRITGFNAGADDYLPKPFSFDELKSRINAVLRRARPQKPPSVLRYEDLVMDTTRHTVTRADRQIILSPQEYNLLEYFLKHPHEVLRSMRFPD